jgi:hypothetical protein
MNKINNNMVPVTNRELKEGAIKMLDNIYIIIILKLLKD